MSPTNDDVALTVAYARSVLGNPTSWKRSAGYPDSIGKSVLDAVYSLRLRYSVVDQIMRRYNASRKAAGADPSKDGLTELIASIEQAGGDDGFSASIGTNNKSAAATKKLPATLKTTPLVRLRSPYRSAASRRRLISGLR